MDIATLIHLSESEILDFKLLHHADTLSLLHDILCLANSWSESDRFLVFGVSDNGTISGVERDPNRRTGANIQDLLRGSRLNRLPTVSMETHQVDGHDIDVLTIKNRPDKPFFVTADREYQGRTIRAGVVYTRIGDTNVPLRESATEASIELAWRERFGLGLPPLRRLFRLLEEPDKWERVEGEAYLYHRDFPEFTVIAGKTLNESFREPWTQDFPDPTARSYVVQLRFGTTILRELVFVSCDGGRYSLPLPRVNAARRYEINRNSLAWRVMQLYQQYFPPEDTLHHAGVDVVAGPLEDG
jgi:hypothetical protein